HVECEAIDAPGETAGEFLDRFASSPLMRIGDDDDGAFFREPRRGGFADATSGGCGHDRYLVLKSLHGLCSCARMLPSNGKSEHLEERWDQERMRAAE